MENLQHKLEATNDIFAATPGIANTQGEQYHIIPQRWATHQSPHQWQSSHAVRQYIWEATRPQ
eukprot:954873-Ditylum_brightwellii.AAC.1